MRLLTCLLALLLTLAQCYGQTACSVELSKLMDRAAGLAQATDLNSLVDGAFDLFAELSPTLRACGMEKVADEIDEQVSPMCLKSLKTEAKLILKLLRLMSEPEPNEALITMNLMATERYYQKTVQKYCPFLREEEGLKSSGNKGVCLEAAYRYSLLVQDLEIDLQKEQFNSSLNDAGKLVLALPDALDACGQKSLAKAIRNDLPKECVVALGKAVRELVAFEHHYDHLEWLKKHWKDLEKVVADVRSRCPALEKISSSQ